jgi:hypothetical protein
MVDPGRGHFGADRGAQRQEERQRCERVEIFGPLRFGEITVQHAIRCRVQTAFDQIHE